MKYNTTHHVARGGKKIAAGPLGQELCKFPLLFTKPVFFGEPQSGINNGTVSLINLGKGPFAITCFHVIEKFRELAREGKQGLFQIGPCGLDPLSQLISQSEHFDLAVIGITEKQAKEITQEDARIGSSFFHPVCWPPEQVSEGEFIALGGFPGRWRTQLASDVLQFGTYSIGASRVTIVRDSYFVSQFEREYWVKSLDNPEFGQLDRLGGLSGGPAFVERGLRLDFVGVIYQFSPNYDLLYLRHAGVIAADGQITQ